MLNPYLVAGGIIIIGGLFIASTASASGGDCEVVEEFVTPFLTTAIMMRRCTREGEPDVVIWDVAMLGDVEIGEDFAPKVWPEESMFHGRAESYDTAVDEAMAWVQENIAWLESGGERGPLATRVEDFLTGLTPVEFAALREVFRFDGGSSDVWPYIDQLRTSTTDESFDEVASTIGHKLALLSDDAQSAMQSDVLSAVGFGNGWDLKNLLSDAGIL